MALQVNLSMAERLSANMKILAQCKRAYPDLAKAELTQMANTIEAEIRQACTSSDDYQKRCEDTIARMTVPNSERPSAYTGDSYIPDAEHPVETIGSYTATYHASGLFSTIYRSSETTIDTDYIAIKLTTPSVMTAPHNSYREARLLRLAVHPTIIPIYTSEPVSGGHYILTLPFLPYDLGTMLDKGSLDRIQIKSHLLSLFEALAHCHSLGILHRDIKPSNILLGSPSGPAYLADFGIAWKEGDPDSEPAREKITDIGTTCYRAPELLFGNTAYGEAVDLWAAGCVIAEAESYGKALFDSGDVGSELALIRSIFSTLGTPNSDTWPVGLLYIRLVHANMEKEAKHFPDWGKMAFREFPAKPWQESLPKASIEGRDLVSHLIKFESIERLPAREVLKHIYFHGIQPNR